MLNIFPVNGVYILMNITGHIISKQTRKMDKHNNFNSLFRLSNTFKRIYKTFNTNTQIHYLDIFYREYWMTAKQMLRSTDGGPEQLY